MLFRSILCSNVGPGVSRYPELLEQRMLTVGLPRSDDRISDRIPVSSMSEIQVRTLFDEGPDRNDRDRPMTEPLAVPGDSVTRKRE